MLAGVIMGTPSYMSPEQASGQPVDKRADVWSFGVVLWEMLTGRRLFDGQTIAHTLADVINKEIRVDDAPAKVQPLLRRCLVRDARKRMRDIGEARIALDKIESGEEDAAFAPIAEKPQRRWQLPALALMTLTAVGLGVYHYLSTRPVDQSLVWLKTDLGVPVAGVSTNGGVAISQDGSKIVFTGEASGKGQLYLRRLDQEIAVPISGTEGASLPFLSPDGNWIGFFADQKLKKVPVNGGVAISLCDAENNRGGSWGEDGFIIASLATNGALMKVPAAGGAPVPLLELRKDERAQRFPQHLPDGKGILFMSVGREAGNNYDAAVIESFSFRDRKRTVLHRGGHYPRYLASGHVAYNFEGALFGLPFQLNRMEAAGLPVQIMAGVQVGLSGSVFFDAARNGTAVFLRGDRLARQSTSVIQWLEGNGKLEPLVSRPGAMQPRFSPDGSRLVFVQTGSAAFRGDVHVQDVRRDIATKLTFDSINVAPIWTPDSKHVVYGNVDGIYWMRSDGGGKPRKLLDAVTPRPTSFSPDGRRLRWCRSARVRRPGEGRQSSSSRALRTRSAPSMRWQQPGSASR
ncbi:MAG: PD40 domain-containing protein [Candidatus Solibacter usitatus]|nr:PD40 domain-containing protein [Candidatus Solibacter usitatus]